MITKTIKQRTGTEVVSFCTKCKIPLAHTIVAIDGETIKKVRCNTCGSEHRFVSQEPKKRATRPRVNPNENWEELMKSGSSKKKVPYASSSKYKEHDVLDHPYFGIGFIVQVINGDKIRVIFQEGEKFLVCGREMS